MNTNENLNAKSFIEEICPKIEGDIQPLVQWTLGKETAWLEFKGYLCEPSGKYTDKNPQWTYEWNLIKSIISMANTPHGGIVILGVGEDEENHQATPLGLYDLKGHYKNGFDEFTRNVLMPIINKDEFGSKKDKYWSLYPSQTLSNLITPLNRRYGDKQVALLCVDPVRNSNELIYAINLKDNDRAHLFIRGAGEYGESKPLIKLPEVNQYKDQRRVDDVFFRSILDRFVKKDRYKGLNIPFDLLKYKNFQLNKLNSDTELNNYIALSLCLTDSIDEEGKEYEVFEDITNNQKQELIENQISKFITSQELVKEAEKKHQGYLIYGPGGTGKTTLLRYLYKEYLNKNDVLPVYISLKDKSLMISEHSLFTVICRILKIQETDLRNLLESHKVILFLDGANEIKDKYRNEIEERLNNFLYDFNKTEFFLTTRNEVIQLKEPIKTKCIKILPIQTEETICNFIKLYGHKSDLNEEELFKSIVSLTEEWRATPFSLKMIIETLTKTKKIYSQSDLYRVVVFELLKREIVTKHRQDKKDVIYVRNKLAKLAATMVCDSSFRKVIIDEKLSELDICVKSLLGEFYDENTNLYFKFKHQIFRDYLAGEFFSKEPGMFLEQLIQFGKKDAAFIKDNILPLVYAAELSDAPSSFLLQENIFNLPFFWREHLLRSITHPKAVNALKKYISLENRTINTLTKSIERKVRYAAALALSEMTHDAALEALKELSQSNDETAVLIATTAIIKSQNFDRSKKNKILQQINKGSLSEKRRKQIIDFSIMDFLEMLDRYIHENKYISPQYMPDIKKIIKNTTNDKIRNCCLRYLRKCAPSLSPARLSISQRQINYKGYFYRSPYPGIIQCEDFQMEVPCLGLSIGGIEDGEEVIFTVKEILYQDILGFVVDEVERIHNKQ